MSLVMELTVADSVVDVGELMFGRIGREIFAAIYCTCTPSIEALQVNGADS
jgi:hypothetical protein